MSTDIFALAGSLTDVQRAAEQITEAEAHLKATVDVARRAGATWQEIGDTLGISRQAAHERFNK